MKLKSLVCAVCFGLALACVVSAAGYQPWSENVFAYIQEQYGPEAETRVRHLHDLVIENQDASVEEKLRLVNDTLNQLPWIADETHWKKADYWAPPIETLATFGGDCEDIAIAKWIMLRHLGVPADHLRLVYVRLKSTGEDHMVLAYVENPEAPREQRTALILDNMDPDVRPASERRDLVALFATDAQGNVVLFNDEGKTRTIKSVHEHVKMRNLEELKRKIAKNMELLQELNGGKPLLSN